MHIAGRVGEPIVWVKTLEPVRSSEGKPASGSVWLGHINTSSGTLTFDTTDGSTRHANPHRNRSTHPGDMSILL